MTGQVGRPPPPALPSVSPLVTTSALPHNATKNKCSCPQRSGERLELSQGRLEAIFPPHRWVRPEIATSGHTRRWEDMPRFYREAAICGLTMYPTWPSEELCAMLGQRVRDPLLLLHQSTSGDWLWQSRFVPSISARAEEAGAMGGSCQFHRLVTRNLPQGVETNQQTHWQVWTLLSPVPRLGKFHRLATREERGTQGRRLRVYQVRQQAAVRSMEDSNTWGSQYLRTFRSEELDAAIRRLKPEKSPGWDYIFPEFILHAVSALKSWFCNFFTSCIRQLRIRKIWRRALVVGIPKPEKPLEDPKSYRPISLLCVPFKSYARVEPIIDPLLPHENAGFRQGRSAVDQVTLFYTGHWG